MSSQIHQSGRHFIASRFLSSANHQKFVNTVIFTRLMSTEKPFVSPIHKLAQNITPEERELMKQRMAIEKKPKEQYDLEAMPQENPAHLPYIKALQDHHEAYNRSLAILEEKRQKVFAETGFSYPRDRYIPKEPRPTAIEHVNKGIFEAAYEKEDYELAWWRFIRTAKYVPPTAESLFVPVPGTEVSPNAFRELNREFYDFTIDKASIQLALYTCTSALEALQRQHNPDVFEKASVLVNGSDEPWYTRLTVHRNGAVNNALFGRQQALLEDPAAAPKPKRVVKGRDSARKLIGSTDTVTDVDNEVPEDDADEAFFQSALVNRSELAAQAEVAAPKLVITEAGQERVLSPEESAKFLKEVKEVEARAKEHRETIEALRKEAREPFCELNWAALQLNVWQDRLLFVCTEALSHYYALLHKVNPDLFQSLTSNRAAPHLSPSGAPAFSATIGNKLDVLKEVCDAAAAAGLHVIYLEATALLLHMSIFLEPVPTLKQRREKLIQRLQREHEAAVQAAEAAGEPAPAFELDHARVAAVDVKMVKVPIIYTGHHRADTKPNNIKNVKFLELTPLTALVPLAEAVDIARNLKSTAMGLHRYFVEHGIDERLVTLPPAARGRTLLGHGSGMRIAATPSNIARHALLLLDGVLVDFARQHQLPLPADFVRVLENSAKITVAVQNGQVAPSTSTEGAANTTETAVAAEPTVELQSRCILGDLSTGPRMTRDEFWRKVKSKELSADMLQTMTVPQRIAALDAKHDGERATNVVALFFSGDREDLLTLYMDLARRAGDRASLAKALTLWRSATRLLEWVQSRSNNDLYVDMVELMGSVHSPDEAEKVMNEVDAERAKDGFGALLAGEELDQKQGKHMKNKQSREVVIENDGETEENKKRRMTLNGVDEDIQDADLERLVEEYAEQHEAGEQQEQQQPESKPNKYPMSVRLAKIVQAPHVDISTDRAMSCLDLLQHLAFNRINILNVGLPLEAKSKCYSDEATALWYIARHQLNDIRAHIVKNNMAPGVDFTQLDRPGEELLPFELEFAKVAIMTMETMLLEQCVPSAQTLAKQVYREGLVQRSLLEDLFQGHLPADL